MKNSLSLNLSNLLKEKKMTMTELAKETGVPKSNIASWITGANPNIYQLDKIYQFFQMPLEELIFGKKILINNEPQVSVEEISLERYEITIRKLSPK